MQHVGAVLRQVLTQYVWDQDDSKAYLLEDAVHHVFAVLVVPKEKPQESLAIIVARIEEGNVIIDTDLTDKPVFLSLVRAGLPRECVICSYAGEKRPLVS
jgi:hypothetical protein